MGTSKKSILLADDDHSDRAILREIFSQLDKSVKIEIVSNGWEILQYIAECAKDKLPCLCILDFNMPFMNGIEVVERLKAEKINEQMPTVIWSAFADKRLMERCIQAGAVNCFPKPEKASELKAIARQMMEYCLT